MRFDSFTRADSIAPCIEVSTRSIAKLSHGCGAWNPVQVYVQDAQEDPDDHCGTICCLMLVNMFDRADASICGTHEVGFFI